MAWADDPRYQRAAARWAALLTEERELDMQESRKILAMVELLPELPAVLERLRSQARPRVRRKALLPVIVPLPIFFTDPADAERQCLRLLGDLNAAADRAWALMKDAHDAMLDVSESGDLDVARFQRLADDMVELVGRLAVASADRGVATRHARLEDRDAVWLANALVDLCQRHQQLACDLGELAGAAPGAAQPPPAPEPAAPPARVVPPGPPGPLRVL